MAQALELTVTDRIAEAKDVVVLELRDLAHPKLPPFEPGAHIEVTLPNGLHRNYSLLNDCREPDRYVIAVFREPAGGGGSEFVHRVVGVGTKLKVAPPLNHFALDPASGSYRFIAGGIGITPILAMIRGCLAGSRPWRLIYAVRNRARAAFYEELTRIGAGHITWNFDDEMSGHLDVGRAVGNLAPGEQVYCCGPSGLMDAVKAALADHPGVAHFEFFKPPAPAVVATPVNHAFKVVLQQSGVTFDVPPDKSILEVLEEHGIDVPFSCREGVCGTCVTPVCDGIPDHRDYVLSDAEHAENKLMTVCVSRAKGDKLVLDL